MGELAQRVQDGQLGVGRGEERESQWNGATNDGISVVKLSGGCVQEVITCKLRLYQEVEVEVYIFCTTSHN